MYSRIVEVTLKAGKNDAFNEAMNKVLGILKAQPGLTDCLVMISDTNPDKALAISVWNSKDEADSYEKAHFGEVRAAIQDVIEGAPTVRTFNVQSSVAATIA